MSPWTLVSPASRGIGRALARRLLQTTDVPVVATARRDLDKSREEILSGLEQVDERRLKVLRLDVLGACVWNQDTHCLIHESTISSAASECGKLFPPPAHHLRLTFAIPGLLFPERSPAQIDAANALLTFRTNSLGPLLLMKHFEAFLPSKKQLKQQERRRGGDPGAADLVVGADGGASLAPARNLPPHAVFAAMSARVGSVSDNALGGWFSYRASKAAVTQAARSFDVHLQRSAGRAAVALALHPGTVKTELSEEFWGSVPKDGLLEPEFAAERLCEVVTREVGVDGRGRFWDWKGEEILP
ncbi:hypothetical protein BDY21DRAFT_414643 [Lineolata rhizophorae]|uniref:NAD(P)-binding protein n=1 Tax=Lineolata rhizophorae TaxID=578093 RepID=A0A6A6P2X3_9PEZI|nr:hypothetical protein BDY21DRAFT_414643 [Lineolata rhizophorae]